MGNKNPMFDIDESEDIKLHDNETSSDQLLKARRSKTVEAIGNKAGVTKKQTVVKTFISGLIMTIVGGIIVAFIVKHYI